MVDLLLRKHFRHALPQLGRAQQVGLVVGLRAFEVREDGLTKLLVGPFDADGLALARARLAELGIESFPR